MPRMKLSDDEFNEKELDVDYEPSSYERYEGDIPKTGTILTARVTKMWWTQSGDGTSMIKLIAVAEQNTGDKAEFNGLPTWEYLTFKPEAAFRYVPFMENFGLTLTDIKKKMMVANDDDNIGTPIESIAGWEPGSDDALARIVIKRDRYEGEWKSKVDRDGWLEYEEPDDEEDEPARPTRGRAAAKTAASSKRGATTTKHRRPEPEPEEDDDDDDLEDYDELDDEDEEFDEEAEEAEDEEAEEAAAPARSSRRTSAGRPRAAAARSGGTGGSRRTANAPVRGDGGSGRSSRASSARSARSAGGRAKGSTEDPPF